MPSQVLTSVENNFTKGLVTEFTGMNFPENAATDCDNVEFTIVGDTVRRLGIDFETNSSLQNVATPNNAINSYKWNNVGGDGNTQFVVTQVGPTLYFWNVTASTTDVPLTNNILASSVSFSGFVADGGTFNNTNECQFTDGNGYLFVFHPDCNPFYCSYNSGTVTANSIAVNIRDFTGIPEIGIADNFRSSSLTASHNYNLFNQGWFPQPSWSATSTTTQSLDNGEVLADPVIWTVQTGLVITVGDSVNITGISGSTTITATGTVISYNSGTGLLTIHLTSVSAGTFHGTMSNWTFSHSGTSYITTFQTAASVYPSNAEQWWRYKNTSDVYSPSTTINNVTLGQTAAPKGHYIFSAFNQDRSGVSSVNGLTTISTVKRPTHGCWFQGRIWYSGVSASQAASGTAPDTTWTENIYFSQIITKVDDFGKCYQVNDPTSEDLFDLLPTDGGIITVQGSGSIYKLFPIQNGMLIFAANGVWFLTGSQGIGFSANDYTLTKISNIQSISTSSFVDVMGLPYFWNEEGIYQVKPVQSGGLEVDPITVGTILSFYNTIPLSSKKNVKCAYHPIDYVIQWIYRSTESANYTEKYAFDKILNYNVYNKAFYPYTISRPNKAIAGIVYVSGPGGASTVEPSFKYFSTTNTQVGFADFNRTDYVDWGSDVFSSYFITGYKLHGQAQRKFQIPYIYVYSRTNGEQMAYSIQSMWDYNRSGDGGRWSSTQQATYVDNIYQTNGVKRHRLRGHGLAVQIKISSIPGQPFDIIGWSVYEVQNMSI